MSYLISGPKREGLVREGWGAYSKWYIFDEVHNNFPNFTITPITKTEQETGFVSPFYKWNVIYILNQAGNKDEVSIESDWNTKEHCWNDIYIGLTDNQVEMLRLSSLFSVFCRGGGGGGGGGLNRELVAGAYYKTWPLFKLPQFSCFPVFVGAASGLMKIFERSTKGDICYRFVRLLGLAFMLTNITMKVPL